MTCFSCKSFFWLGLLWLNTVSIWAAKRKISYHLKKKFSAQHSFQKCCQSGQFTCFKCLYRWLLWIIIIKINNVSKFFTSIWARDERKRLLKSMFHVVWDKMEIIEASWGIVADIQVQVELWQFQGSCVRGGNFEMSMCVWFFLGWGRGASTKHWPVKKRKSSCVV